MYDDDVIISFVHITLVILMLFKIIYVERYVER